MSVVNHYSSIKERLDNLREEQVIQERLAMTHKELIDKIKKEIEDDEKVVELLDKALVVFQEVSDERNRSAKESLETVINWALSKVFTHQDYTLRIEESADARSGKTMEVYLVDSNTGNVRSLRNQTGTALSQIIAFLMILSVIKFAGSSKVLILDEVFSGLEDTDMVTMFSDILTSLARNDGFQGILVEQNSLISSNENFIRIHLALDDYEEGLKVTRYEYLEEEVFSDEV